MLWHQKNKKTHQKNVFKIRGAWKYNIQSLTDPKILNQNTLPSDISLHLCTVRFEYSPERLIKEIRQYNNQQPWKFFFST